MQLRRRTIVLPISSSRKLSASHTTFPFDSAIVAAMYDLSIHGAEL